MSFYRFFSEETDEIVLLMECLQQEGFYGVQVLKFLNYWESSVFINLQKFLSKFN